MEETLELWLKEWIREYCTTSISEGKKGYQVNIALRRIAQDERFWRKRKDNYLDDYADCFLAVFDYFLKWLCDVPKDKDYSDKKESFNQTPDRAVPRLLSRRTGCLKTKVIERARNTKRYQVKFDHDGSTSNTVDAIADIAEEEATMQIYERRRSWIVNYVEQDSTGELKETYIRDRPAVNMQAYLRFWLQGKTVTDMAKEFSCEMNDTSPEKMYNAISSRNPSWWRKVESWKRRLIDMAENEVL